MKSNKDWREWRGVPIVLIEPKPRGYVPAMLGRQGRSPKILPPFSLFEVEQIQIIVKLANIHLTPDKPVCSG